MKFSDLNEGDKFRFIGGTAYCIKGEGATFYREDALYYTNDNKDVEVPKVKTFRDLMVGDQFYWFNGIVIYVKLNTDMYCRVPIDHGNREEYVQDSKRVVVAFDSKILG